jgi:GntR family transcriptional repressor for pyruvate dehydrogenase complex
MRGSSVEIGATSLARRSLADQVADALSEFILTEGLREGDPLPSSGDLAARFDVSRTVIREALAALAGRGVLVRSQGRESVVATPGASDLVNLLQFRVQHGSASLTDILDARLGLEITAARRAAEHATKNEVAAIGVELDAMRAAKRDADYHQADIRLHRAIAVASHNPIIVLMLDALSDLLMEFRVTATENRKARGASLEPIFGQHARIVEAIDARDPDQAAEAMREHLETGRLEIA